MKTMLDQVNRQKSLEERKANIAVAECIAILALAMLVVVVLA